MVVLVVGGPPEAYGPIIQVLLKPGWCQREEYEVRDPYSCSLGL